MQQSNKIMTNEELARIFAAYYGAIAIQMINKVDGVFGKLVQIEQKGCGILMSDDETISFEEWDKCRLLLKNLSAISDEDAKEFCRILALDYNNDPFSCAEFDLDGLRKAISIIGEECFVASFSMIQEAIDYLRSKSYNIGYLNYSPADLVSMGVVVERGKEVENG